MLKVALLGHYKNYEKTLIPSSLYSIERYELASPLECDILITGPFLNRSKFEKIKFKLRNKKAIILFHSSENTRMKKNNANFFITSDLGINQDNHIRIPHWYNIIDWSHDGVKNTLDNDRFGRMITIDELMRKRSFQDASQRKKRAAAICAHLNQPRQSLFENLQKVLEVDGYGPAFEKDQNDHNAGVKSKISILQDYLFNFCPENSMHPGYYTEKPVEAWAAGCIPIYWADPMFEMDFNKKSIINLYDYYNRDLKLILDNEEWLEMTYEEPLVLKRPSLEEIKFFLRKILDKI